MGRGKKGLRYEGGAERVYINAEQYFAPVPAEVWAYPVGGYQVCQKYLKDRTERALSLEEVRTYCRIVTALARTMEVQEEVEALYERVEKRTVGMGR